MEIQALRFVVTESDLNELTAGFVPQIRNIRDLRIAVLPEGIRVSGTYETAVRIPFETLWRLSVSEGKILVTLEKLKSGILSLALAKGYLLRAIAGTLHMLDFRDDKIILDVDLLLRNKGVPLRTNLKRVRCDYGSLTIES